MSRLAGRGWRLAGLSSAIVLLAVAPLAACSDDSDRAGGGDGGDSATTTTAPPVSIEPAPYPPNDDEELAELFDPVLEPLGLRLTRGALIDRGDGNYDESATGRHLALYAEPIDEDTYPVERYVDGIWEVTAAVTPLVFDSWSELDTYDICQEPLPSQDDREEPFPLTQVELGREDYETFDWEVGDLPSLLGYLDSHPETTLLVSNQVAASEEYREAQEAAGTDS